MVKLLHGDLDSLDNQKIQKGGGTGVHVHLIKFWQRWAFGIFFFLSSTYIRGGGSNSLS